MSIEPTQGLIIAKRYRLERRIGEGGMGAVWAATHTITAKTLALKFLKAPEAHRVALTQRFLREARAACAVEHPNIVQVFDVFELDDGSPVMVMELLTGESLQQKLSREKRVRLTELARLMLPVCSAVGCAHAAGVVHRDLKPDNIFLARGADGSMTVKVLDFGIAKLVLSGAGQDAPGLATGTGVMMGTPHYMSPEQVEADKSIDHRSDTWSLGIILYQCLTGSLPTWGENLGQILKTILVGPLRPLSDAAPWLPGDVTDLVDRMLTRDRTLRPRGLGEVSAVLERYAAGIHNAEIVVMAQRVPADESALSQELIAALAPTPLLDDAGATTTLVRVQPPTAFAAAPPARKAGDTVPFPAGHAGLILGLGAVAPVTEPAMVPPVGPEADERAVDGSTQAPLSRSVPGLAKPARGVRVAVAAVVAGALAVAGWWTDTGPTPPRAIGESGSAEPEARGSAASAPTATAPEVSASTSGAPPPDASTAAQSRTKLSPDHAPSPASVVKPTASTRAPAESTTAPRSTTRNLAPQASATATGKRHEGIH